MKVPSSNQHWLGRLPSPQQPPHKKPPPQSQKVSNHWPHGFWPPSPCGSYFHIHCSGLPLSLLLKYRCQLRVIRIQTSGDRNKKHNLPREKGQKSKCLDPQFALLHSGDQAQTLHTAAWCSASYRCVHPPARRHRRMETCLSPVFCLLDIE